MIKRRSSSESNKKRSDKRTDPSSSTKGKSTLSSWHKFKMSLSMRKKEKPRKVEESEVSNSVDLTNLEGPPALKKQTVDDAGFESTPTVESKDSLKKEKESSSGRRHNESNAGKKAAAPPAPVQDATPKVDSSAKKARGIRRKFSASKPASKKAAVRVQVENKPAVETCFVQDKLDHKALEAKMKKKHRRDLCLSIGIAYCSAVIMVGLAVSGLVGTYFYYHTHFELQRHKLIALYAAKNSKWEIHNCGKLNATMDMYRKRGRMYEHSKCELRRNQSTLDAAPWKKPAGRIYVLRALSIADYIFAQIHHEHISTQLNHQHKF
ncbi:hypothetical protein QR680_018256 [Steinernema hermaphroditum]|uniref:Uncharacterized protein n=1 Tax=Steinernema hermaphroditum TaxID=289476 RepID=A0AA39HHE1_9BILA|nr:hypothetical protein QR680_018256 [Steinernema hermaphroditum]